MGDLLAEFFEAPVVVVAVDQGGDWGAELAELLVGGAVDDLLIEGAVEAFDADVGFGLTEQGETGGSCGSGGWIGRSR